MKERIIQVIDGMKKDNIYDDCLERIINFVTVNYDLTRQDIINFVNGEIDYTEHDCNDQELKGYVCDVFITFLCRF